MSQPEPESEQYVCYECCVSPLLQQVVTRQGEIATCGLCGASDVRCAGTGSDEFLLAIKASIRYHFGEWQYHSKLGDGSLEALFFIDPNPILKVHPDQKGIDREEAILSFLDDVNDRAMQVEVYTAYGRDIYNYYPHTPVCEGASEILRLAKRALAERNHFVVEDEYEKILRPILPYISSTVNVGTRWHRARMGAKQAAANFEALGGPPTYFYEAHKEKAIGAPPVGVATAGRVNRPGGACSDTSLVLGAVLDDAGFGGFECIWGQIDRDDGTSTSHSWLQHGHLVVDITADQFDDVIEPVIVSTNSEWHKQWQVKLRTPGDLKLHFRHVSEQFRLYGEVEKLLGVRAGRYPVDYFGEQK